MREKANSLSGLHDGAFGRHIIARRGPQFGSEKIERVIFAGGADNSLRLWDSAVSGDKTEMPLLSTFMTKATPVYSTRFTPRNLLMGAGALTLGRKSRK